MNVQMWEKKGEKIGQIMIIEACWRKGTDAKTGRREAEEKQRIAERLCLRDSNTF